MQHSSSLTQCTLQLFPFKYADLSTASQRPFEIMKFEKAASCLAQVDPEVTRLACFVAL
jgi:hypothetical protein